MLLHAVVFVPRGTNLFSKHDWCLIISARINYPVIFNHLKLFVVFVINHNGNIHVSVGIYIPIQTYHSGVFKITALPIQNISFKNVLWDFLLTWRWRQHILMKQMYLCTKLYGATSQKTVICKNSLFCF